MFNWNVACKQNCFLGVATHYNILRNIADAAIKLCLQVRGQNGQHFRKNRQIVFWLSIGWLKKRNWLINVPYNCTRWCWWWTERNFLRVLLLSQQCVQRFQCGHTMQSITWWENFKFLFDFLNSQTRQTNGSFKSCNSHINACRDAASTETKCPYSWLDSGMQIWDRQPEL